MFPKLSSTNIKLIEIFLDVTLYEHSAVPLTCFTAQAPHTRTTKILSGHLHKERRTVWHSHYKSANFFATGTRKHTKSVRRRC